MKKIIILFILVLTLYNVYNSYSKEETIVIPDKAIRLRVVPNSNSLYDLEIKSKVKEYLEKEIYPLLNDTLTIEEAKTIIEHNINIIETNIKRIFKENNYNKNFTINFGDNYFPNKKYKSIIYPEGYYESLVIYIGESIGDNWWCVLFPPLCLLDADDKEDTNNVEYTLYIKELLEKIF